MITIIQVRGFDNANLVEIDKELCEVKKKKFKEMKKKLKV